MAWSIGGGYAGTEKELTGGRISVCFSREEPVFSRARLALLLMNTDLSSILPRIARGIPEGSAGERLGTLPVPRLPFARRVRVAGGDEKPLGQII